MLREELEAIIYWDKSVIAWASLLVAIGLVGEYKENIKSLWLTYWDAFPINFSVAKQVWRSLLSIVFPLMVIFGVAVEWKYEADVSGREAEYAAALDAENAAIKTQAAEAFNNAKQTFDRTKWRTIAPSQCAQVIDELAGIKGSLWIESVFGDPESTALGINLQICFQSAGWTLSSMSLGVGPRLLPINLTVSGENTEKAAAVRKALSHAFSMSVAADDTLIEQSILSRMSEMRMGPAEVKIIVGSRPIIGDMPE